MAENYSTLADTGPSGVRKSGLPYALGAYTIWGLIPLYIVLLNAVDPFALVGWRIIWTVPICIVLIGLRGQLGEVKAAFASGRVLGSLTISSLLITVNWVTYILAIQQGEYYAASLGYYINPLVNVMLGTLVLKERLSKLQWGAVVIAALGVGVLALEAGSTLVISLSLAVSFALYGLVRKRTAVGALPGLTVEVLLMMVPAAIAVAFFPTAPAMLHGVPTQLLLVGAGILTGVPLLLFATAARRMEYSTLGFIQFLAPTIVFLLGLTVLGEPLDRVRLVCFLFIWTSIVIFCLDLYLRGRARRVMMPE